METTTKSDGKWTLTLGGSIQYCSVGQHFTEGPTWKFFQSDAKSVMCVCDECAQKEAA